MTGTPESIRAEADRVKARSVELKAALAADPQNAAIRQELASLKARFDALGAAYREAKAAAPQPAESPLGGLFDPAQFDVALDRPTHRPVVLSPEDTFLDKLGGLLRSSAFWRHTMAALLLLVTGFVFLLIMLGDVGFYQVPSESMVPTFQPGDNLIAMAAKQYNRGDVIVIPDPSDRSAFLTKRIVAKAGDTVEVRNQTLFVNGQAIMEPYLREPMEYRLSPMIVGTGEVFLLGDNRNESEDSHLWGKGLREADVKGKVFYIYRPSARRGTLKDYETAFAGL